MSYIIKLAKQFKVNQASKSNQGTNGLMVRDSHWYAIGALIGFINPLVLLCIISTLTITILSLSTNVIDTYATSSSITVTIDDNVVDLNVAPTGQGAFSKSSVSTIGVSTTNATGYTLKMVAQEGDNPTALVNGSSSLASIESALTESQFRALDSTAYNNQWGYLPSNLCTTSNGTTTCSANTSFLPSPSTEGDTLDITSTANATGVVNEYELTLGARVDTTAAMGSYSNTFVIYAAANNIPYTITYVDNTISNMPTDIDEESTSTAVTISSKEPQRNGYTFIGWCTVTPTNNANGTDTCPSPGTQVAAGGTLTISQTASENNFTLYAMWSGNYTIEGLVSGNGTMQDLGTMSASKQARVIDSMVEETNYTLKDSRDNQNYTIAKLKDGQIWMTTNLNIAGGSTLTANDTDIPAAYTLPTANGFGADNTLPASSTTGFSSNTMAYVYNSGNTTNCGASGQDTPCYSYYSYIAATAGSGLTVTGDGEDAAWSICPKGWRLPISGDGTITTVSTPTSYKRGDPYKLATIYGINLESAYNRNTTAFYDNLGPGTPSNFLLSGYYLNAGSYNLGVAGPYWSSTGGTNDHAKVLSFDPGYFTSASNYVHRAGVSIRCILK